MKYCAYCNEPLGTPNHTKTDEHVLPNSLLKLYPEQDISFRNDNYYVDNRGITISDVCSSCNNGVLAELDAYGHKLIKDSFYYPYKFEDYYHTFDISLNTNLFTRWILKIAYNSIRCDKRSDQYIKECIPYIMSPHYKYPPHVSILMGLHINLNPIPEELFDFLPLQITYEPIFFLNSNLRHMQGEPQERLLLKGVGQVICIRLGNAISLIIFWKDCVSQKTKEIIHSTLQDSFRFRLLVPGIDRYSIRSVSSPTNVMTANYGHFFSEQAVSEIINTVTQSLHGRHIGACYDEFCERWKPEDTKKSRALIEASLFPKNAKKKKALDNLFNKDT